MFESEFGHWGIVKDGDDTARALFDKHYSRIHYKDERKPKLFCGPGSKLVLRTTDGTALFVWRVFKDASGQQGINCAVFRNESTVLSSLLILEAEELAKVKWPNIRRFYTYVKASAIKSVNPGYCYKRAGWQVCGLTKAKKLVILEKLW